MQVFYEALVFYVSIFYIISQIEIYILLLSIRKFTDVLFVFQKF